MNETTVQNRLILYFDFSIHYTFGKLCKKRRAGEGASPEGINRWLGEADAHERELEKNAGQEVRHKGHDPDASFKWCIACLLKSGRSWQSAHHRTLEEANPLENSTPPPGPGRTSRRSTRCRRRWRSRR